MGADHVAVICRGECDGDQRAEVAALGDVPVVAEAVHQLAHARATRVRSQPVSVTGPENPYPGTDGMTRWNASARSPPCAPGSWSGPMTLRNSATEPGQPWVRISGRAVGSGDRTWRKCTFAPSISVVYWGN